MNSTNEYEIIFNRMKKSEKSADTWVQFINQAITLFQQKDTDYDSRFMRGLLTLDARSLWFWEIDKKLDRLRTWIKRGELQVKGEGIRNSVDDIFVYTVQYSIYSQARGQQVFTVEEWQKYKNILFIEEVSVTHIDDWLKFLESHNRIKPQEVLLKLVMRMVMGESVTIDDWRSASKFV
jgi:hypothetical protein